MFKSTAQGWFVVALSILAMAPQAPAANASAATLDIMFYNVYNLFDADHDEGKDDWTFLPQNTPGKQEHCQAINDARYREECLAVDWTEAHVQLKLAQLTKAFAAARPTLPDFVGLAEVENPRIVGRLAQQLGYANVAMSNSPDERGIDVALLYNLKPGLEVVGEPQQHTVVPLTPADRPTRNILEVKFRFHGQELIFFVNHWPSQSATAPAPVRVNVAKQVQALVDQRLSTNADAHIVVFGDFNTIDSDFPHPFRTVFHDASARHPLLDSYDEFRKSRADAAVKNQMAAGTYFYPPRMGWDRLDRIFTNGNLSDGRGLEADFASFRILSPDLLCKTYVYDDDRYAHFGSQIKQSPFRPDFFTDSPNLAGYSDHFPIFMQLKLAKDI